MAELRKRSVQTIRQYPEPPAKKGNNIMTSESDLNDASRALSETVAQAFPEGLPTAEQAAERALELFASLQGGNAVSPSRRGGIPMAEMSRRSDGVALSDGGFSADVGTADLRAAIAALGAATEEDDSDD